MKLTKPLSTSPTVPPAVRWVLAGAGYGWCMRALFGLLPQHASPMSIAFLIVTPLVVGFITSSGDKKTKRSVARAAFLPWVSIILMEIGCAITALEGSICIVLMTPVLFFFASIGGLCGAEYRDLNDDSETTIRSLLILPLLVVFAENYVPVSPQELQITDSVVINAPPARVWKEIIEARNIRPEELPRSVSHIIGVPKPLEGVNVSTPNGEVRYSKWERGVNFRAKITNREINKSISWRYEFDSNSFPKGSMDEHVAIGGRYFNLNDTTFKLRARDDGNTELELSAHYRVTTPINFYAVPAANLLGRDFVATILGLYKGRSERQKHG
jgi:hypothetical protein